MRRRGIIFQPGLPAAGLFSGAFVGEGPRLDRPTGEGARAGRRARGAEICRRYCQVGDVLAVVVWCGVVCVV